MRIEGKNLCRRPDLDPMQYLGYSVFSSQKDFTILTYFI